MIQSISSQDNFEEDLGWALRCRTLSFCLATKEALSLSPTILRKIILRTSKPSKSYKWHFLDAHFNISTAVGRAKADIMDFAHRALCEIWGFDDRVAYERLLKYPLNTPFMGYSRSVQEATFVRTWQRDGEDWSYGPEWVDRLVPCGIMRIIERKVVDGYVHICLLWMSGPKCGIICVVKKHISLFCEQHVVPNGGTWPSRSCPAHVAFIPSPLVYLLCIMTVGLIVKTLTAAWPWIAKAAGAAWAWGVKSMR